MKQTFKQVAAAVLSLCIVGTSMPAVFASENGLPAPPSTVDTGEMEQAWSEILGQMESASPLETDTPIVPAEMTVTDEPVVPAEITVTNESVVLEDITVTDDPIVPEEIVETDGAVIPADNATLDSGVITPFAAGADVIMPFAADTPAVATAEADVFWASDASLKYHQQYAYGSDKIGSYECTGSQGGYAGSNGVSRVFDDSFTTHWETTQPNTSSFSNYIDVTFTEELEIDRLLFVARANASQKGYPTTFEIYTLTEAEVSAGTAFRLTVTGGHTKTSAPTMISFPAMRVKKLRFLFKSMNSGDGGYAGCSMLRFFKPDDVMRDLNALFADATQAALAAGVDATRVQAMESRVRAYPLSQKVWPILQNAYTLAGQTPPLIVPMAKVTEYLPSTHAASAEYFATYGITSDMLTSLKNASGNTGGYSSTVAKAIDDSFSTFWHTSTTQSASYQNALDFTFDNVYEVNRILFATRHDAGYKGFATSFDIYAQLENDTGLTLISQGSHPKTGNAIMIAFNPVRANRIRFVWTGLDSNDGGWASCSMLRIFKPDAVQQELDDLFTDSTQTALKSTVTEQTLDALQMRIRTYPLGDVLWESLQTAYDLKGLDAPILAYPITFRSWSLHTASAEVQAEYNAQYQVDSARSAVVTDLEKTANAPKLYDGNFTTNWQASRGNSNTYISHVTFSFPQNEQIARIAYIPHTEGGNTRKGYPAKFQVFGTTSAEDTGFRLVATGELTQTDGALELILPQITTFRQLRFVYITTSNGNPAGAEFAFYKPDTMSDEVMGLFTDSSCAALLPSVTMETVQALEARLNVYPMAESLRPYLDAAIALLGGTADAGFHEPMVLSQRGNRGKEASRTRINYSLSTFDVAGYYARPGEVFDIFVNADPKGPMPRFVLATVNQKAWSWAYGQDGTPLQNGYNRIVAPANMVSCQVIYFYNPATPEEQAFPPTVRFSGGTEYPVYRYNTNNPDASETSEAFLARLDAYVEQVTDNIAQAQAGAKKFNACELVSDNVIISTSARGAQKGLRQSETNSLDGKIYTGPKDVMHLYEVFYKDLNLYSGFNIDDPTHPDYRNRNQFLLRVYTEGAGLGWAQSGFAGFNAGSEKENNPYDGGFYASLATVGNVLKPGWAVYHEIGHIFDTNTIDQSESTNNLYCLDAQMRYQDKSRMDDENRWWNHFTTYINTGILPHNDRLFYPGAVIFQLDAVNFGATTLYKDPGLSNYGRACRYARLNFSSIKDLDKMNRLIVSMSMAAGVDLSDHFAFYGQNVKDEVRQMLSGLPKETRPTWFANGRTFKGGTFTSEMYSRKPVVESTSVNAENGAVTFTMKQDTYLNAEGNSKDLQCFAIYRQDITDPANPFPATPEFVGITDDNKSTGKVNEVFSFTDKDVMAGHKYAYTVSAYDCYLKETAKCDPIEVSIPDTADVPIERILINKGEFGIILDPGKQFKVAVRFFPENATVDLSQLTWDLGTPEDKLPSIRLLEDPDYPGDPTHRIVETLRGGWDQFLTARLGRISTSFRFRVNDKAVGLTSLEMDRPTFSLAVGGETTLTAAKLPENTSDTTAITWSSDRSDIASVDANGVVTAVAAGTATITAAVGSIITTSTVVVEAAPIPATDLSITASTTPFKLYTGRSDVLTATASPNTATNITPITWSVVSEAPTIAEQTVATVDANTGEVKAVSAGTAVLRATMDTLTKDIPLTVEPWVGLQYISLNKPAHTITSSADTFQLTVQAYPTNTTDSSPQLWKSSNTKIVTVDENGLVTPVTAGTATITASRGGKYTTCDITVDYDVPLTGVNFRGKAVDTPLTQAITAGSNMQLSLMPSPISATNIQPVVWSSDNEAVATVDSKTGYVTAIKAGQAVITGSITQTSPATVTKSLTATFTVKANEVPLTGIGISQATAALAPAQTLPLSVMLRPVTANVGVTTPVWTSSNPEAATVDANTGLVTAGTVSGVANITVTVGAFTAQCVVTTTVPRKEVETLTAVQPEFMLTVGQTKALQLTATPADVAYVPRWSVSSSDVVSVDQSGNVTARGVGSAAVYAVANGKLAVFNVTVTAETIQIVYHSSGRLEVSNPAVQKRKIQVIRAFYDTEGFLIGSRVSKITDDQASWTESGYALPAGAAYSKTYLLKGDGTFHPLLSMRD